MPLRPPPGLVAGLLALRSGAARGYAQAAGRRRVRLPGPRRTRTGHRVSEDGGNRTKRTWQVNLQNKTLRSELLAEDVPLQVSANTLRCIRKEAGLDNYLLRTRADRLGSPEAADLKAEVEAARRAQAPAGP